MSEAGETSVSERQRGSDAVERIAQDLVGELREDW